MSNHFSERTKHYMKQIVNVGNLEWFEVEQFSSDSLRAMRSSVHRAMHRLNIEQYITRECGGVLFACKLMDTAEGFREQIEAHKGWW